MNEEARTQSEPEAGGGAESGGDAGREQGGPRGGKGRGGRMGEGFRQGIGVLSAFKDALEETIQEARDRGDLSTERAREVMKEALGRAQAAAEGARDRLDFAHSDELEALQATVRSIRERLSALEEQVFGASREPPADEGATYAEPERGAGDDSPVSQEGSDEGTRGEA
jgi:polyhydroxyalkanoate synthesis regulator phasin